MNEAIGPDPEERLFAESVRDGVRQLRKQRGSCPSAEELVAFLEGRLESEDSARVGEHVDACGVCDLALMRVRAAEPAGRGMSAWRRVSDLFRNPLLGYGVAAALCCAIALATLIVVVIPGRRVASPTLPAPLTIAGESVPTINLNLSRGTEGLHVPLGAGDRFVLLSFLIDIHPAFHYSASLDGGTAREVMSDDGKGNFALLFSRNLLNPGKHRLIVTEINPGNGKNERSIEFTFSL